MAGSERKPLSGLQVWFVAGSQELYGEEVLATVASDARAIAAAVHDAAAIPVSVVAKPVVTSPEAIRALCLAANSDDRCVGLILWMHTFSPAKMWIAGLGALAKPILHLHTQFNAALPWAQIDMEYMNTHQSAHGDREFGFIETRMGVRRKTVVGDWRDGGTLERIGRWARAACGWHESGRLRVARFGDNMREVAVTEGDKVEAQIRLGLSVSGYGVGDLAAAVDAAPQEAVDALVSDYEQRYELAGELAAGGARRGSLLDAARIEAGLRAFLDERGALAFTDTFEDLRGLRQLPGIAAQRLMADGYGFAAEGDWKTAALLRIVKVMATGMAGGTSFMEDYTYDLAGDPQLVLGSHMLEICPSIAAGRPSAEIHPLSIGGAEDPVRLVFTAAPGPAVVVAMVDLGDRFRLIANLVDVVTPAEPLPRLPVARALWKPLPDFATAAEAWLCAGGAHHTVYTAALDIEVIADFAEIAGIELLVIDERTRMRDFRNELRWNQAYHRLARGF
ncbi:MAG TPA: L-arabinose isomerase [Solirubrobacteraceae bacterium]|nr:L-arabinose isomerase [Solirubrobacteraceae bacterium]